MTRPWILIFAAATLLASGCSKAPEPPPAGAPDEAVEVKPAETKTIAKPEAKLASKPAAKPAVTEGAKAAVAKATPTPAAKKPASKLVAWDAPIAWLDWDAGLAKAKAEKKAIMLLVFADW
jgi:hypothetical protein